MVYIKTALALRKVTKTLATATAEEPPMFNAHILYYLFAFGSYATASNSHRKQPLCALEAFLALGTGASKDAGVSTAETDFFADILHKLTLFQHTCQEFRKYLCLEINCPVSSAFCCRRTPSRFRVLP